MAGDDDMAASDPLWDDVCETLLSLAKARPTRRRNVRGTSKQAAYGEWLRDAARMRPPGAGTMAALALEAFPPGAWLSMQDLQARMGVMKWDVGPILYHRLWRRGWVEQIDDPEAAGRKRPGKGPRGPRKLWRLTALGEAVRAALLSGARVVAEFEDRPPVGLAENPAPRTPAKRKPRRSGASRAGGKGRRERRLSPRTGRAG